MPRVLIDNYDAFYDLKNRVEFKPVLDLHDGCHKGVADVSRETAQLYDGRYGFRLLSDAEWQAMTSRPEHPEPVGPVTGDPLADAAHVISLVRNLPLAELSHKELVALAKQHHVRAAGVTRETLIASLEAKLQPAAETAPDGANPAGGPPPPPPSA